MNPVVSCYTCLEAFSDGVIAVIITIMVLELKVPAGASLHDLWSSWPIFLAYVLSFTMVGIYWNNHHHLLQAAQKVNGTVLWANLHLLFWLSLMPFATNWMGYHPRDPWPFALYGVIMLFAGVAYTLLTVSLVHLHGRDSLLAKSIRNDTKGKVSLVIDVVALALVFVHTWLAAACWVVLLGMWFLPDRRIESNLQHEVTAAD